MYLSPVSRLEHLFVFPFIIVLILDRYIAKIPI